MASVTDTPAREAATDRLAGLARRLLLSEYFVLYLSVAYLLVLIPFVSGIATPSNFEGILSNMWPLMVIAIGQTFVLITGGIDLSQTAVMGLVSVTGAALITQGVQEEIFGNTPLWGTLVDQGGGLLNGVGGALLIAALVMILIGGLVGLLNGSAITRLSMPPFMVTLVSLTLFTAVAIWLSKSERVGGLPLSFLDLSERNVGDMPTLGFINVTPAVLIAVAVAVTAHLLLSRTVFGRWLYAIGTNAETARISGVPVARTITWAYVISGACAAIGGLLYSARLGIGQPNLGSDASVLLDIIGATVIGGTSLYGGRGKVLWTVFGVFFYVLLSNSLNLMDLSFYTVTIVKGSVILSAVVLDTMRQRLAATSRRAQAPAPAPAGGAA